MIRPIRLIVAGCALLSLALTVPAGDSGATPASRDTQTFPSGAQVSAANWAQMPNLTATGAPPGSNAADNAVSCVDADFCMGVGSPPALTTPPSPPFAELWNGTTWAELPLTPIPGAPNGSTQLAGVSCLSSQFCVAVGNAVINTNGNKVEEPLIEQWDGATWNVVQDSGSDNTGLEDVSCLSATFCMAVGATGLSSSSVTVDEWNGSTWSLQFLPDPVGTTDAFGFGISCTTPAFCMIVGAAGTTQSGGAYAAAWDGATWTPTTVANGFNDAILQSVSCAGTQICTADGTGGQNGNHPVIDTWSGGVWAQTTAPALPAQGRLFGISCISATSCTAVGSYALGSTGSPLVFTWNGLTWTQPPNAPTPGSPQSYLTDVSCVANWSCVAVGTFETSGSDFLPFDALAPIARSGYRFVAADGGVFSYGAPFYGSLGGTRLDAPIIGMATMPAGDGYYLAASDGGVFAYGAARFDGSMGGKHLNRPIVGIAVTPDGGGYWLVASDGGVFAFGDALYFGSMGGRPLNRPVVGIAAAANGAGYYEVASDGGIFSFPSVGGPAFEGSTGALRLNRPIVGMTLNAAGQYYLVASDGGVFAFGGAPYFGSTGSFRLAKPVIGMTTTSGGYYLGASDGGVFAFPTTNGPPFFGSTGGQRLAQPIVGLSG